mmetsp:Transcript_11636/g.48790  ORF Transcript_11636/g.48790 Transcript_11636/m.48790 type:complete len:206 (+) Transcript_11636:770-1387(+)
MSGRGAADTPARRSRRCAWTPRRDARSASARTRRPGASGDDRAGASTRAKNRVVDGFSIRPSLNAATRRARRRASPSPPSRKKYRTCGSYRVCAYVSRLPTRRGARRTFSAVCLSRTVTAPTRLKTHPGPMCTGARARRARARRPRSRLAVTGGDRTWNPTVTPRAPPRKLTRTEAGGGTVWFVEAKRFYFRSRGSARRNSSRSS